MVDTQRSQATLLTSLFADGQAAGSITPQDVRDAIISLSPPYGGLSFTIPAATTISTPGVMVKAAGTTAVTNVRDFTTPGDNRLTFVGVSPRHMHIAMSLSFTTAGTNDRLSIAIARNGSVLTPSKLTRFVGTGSDQASTASHADIILNVDDFLEIFVTNEDAAADVTVEQGYIFACGMLV